MFIIMYVYIRVMDSRTGYLLPVRVALWDLPGWMCCWHVVVAVTLVVIVGIGIGIILYFHRFQ